MLAGFCNMQWTKDQIKAMDKLSRLNLINSITGIKPANLIGTKSEKGYDNLAIISSVVHMGSNPALIGFFTRPTEDVRRDTYNNIVSTGYYTINHAPVELLQNAHYTSAKFDEEVSEFDQCGFNAEYVSGFSAPFVKESPIKIGMKLVDQQQIILNNTILMIGEVVLIEVVDEAIEEGNHLNLEKSLSSGISGLNSYYSIKKEAQFPYARVAELPEF